MTWQDLDLVGSVAIRWGKRTEGTEPDKGWFPSVLIWIVGFIICVNYFWINLSSPESSLSVNDSTFMFYLKILARKLPSLRWLSVSHYLYVYIH